jgi:hypothetical protein
VRVRLVVQVPAANRAEAGAVGAAEDLVRERERGRVARPAREVEAVVDGVLRRELLGVAGARRLVLARRDRQVEHRVVEAAIARPVEPDPEPELEESAGARAADRKLGRHLLGDGQVALAAELERLELELDLVAVFLAGTQFERPQVERLHAGQGSSGRAARRERGPRPKATATAAADDHVLAITRPRLPPTAYTTNTPMAPRLRPRGVLLPLSPYATALRAICV